MNFSVRVSAPVAGLAAKIRATVRAGKRGGEEPAVAFPLPSTSNVRDPAEIAALSSFDDPEIETV